MFFAETQNELLYAVIKETAVEIVFYRADTEDMRYLENLSKRLKDKG